jgi:hypothetical protein
MDATTAMTAVATMSLVIGFFFLPETRDVDITRH